MPTTPAPPRPRFTQDARGHSPCPAPTCRQTFTRRQGVSRHWNQQHGQPDPEPAFKGDPELDALNDLWAEVQAEKDAEQKVREEIHATLDEIEHDGAPGPLPELPDTAYPADATPLDAPAEEPTYREKWATLFGTAPATAAGIHLLTPQQVADHTTTIDAVLALSDSTVGLVDAITRLVGVGYSRSEALTIVLDLIDKLGDRVAA